MPAYSKLRTRPISRGRKQSFPYITMYASDPEGFSAMVQNPTALAARSFPCVPLDAHGRPTARMFSAAFSANDAAEFFCKHDWSAIGVVNLSVPGEASIWPMIEVALLRENAIYAAANYSCIAGDLDFFAAHGRCYPRGRLVASP